MANGRRRYKAKFRGWGNINIMGIVFGLVVIIATLWGGGIAVNALGTTMDATCSPFYTGLSLIGWTVNSSNCITDTSGSGLLAIVGIFGMLSILGSIFKVQRY